MSRFTIVWMSGFSSRLRRHWLTLMTAMVLGVLMWDGWWSRPGARDLLLLRHHRAVLARERDQLLRDSAIVRDRITRLKSDDAYVQQLIRRDLGYVRQGEIVYRFPNSEQR